MEANNSPVDTDLLVEVPRTAALRKVPDMGADHLADTEVRLEVANHRADMADK